MKSEFSRVITLLRKEKNISQKQADSYKAYYGKHSGETQAVAN